MNKMETEVEERFILTRLCNTFRDCQMRLAMTLRCSWSARQKRKKTVKKGYKVYTFAG